MATVYPHVWTFEPGTYQRYPIITIPYARALGFSTTGEGVEGEAVIGHVIVERVNDPKVNVKLEVAPSIAFSDGVFINPDVVDILTVIQSHLLLTVLPNLTAYL
jgi:hypothetical protein